MLAWVSNERPLPDVLHRQVHGDLLALLHAAVAVVAGRDRRRPGSCTRRSGRSSAWMVGRSSTGAGSPPPAASNLTLRPSVRVSASIGILQVRLGVLVLGLAGPDLAPLDVAPAERRLGGAALPGRELAEDELLVLEVRVVALGGAAQAVDGLLAVVGHGDLQLHGLAGGDLVPGRSVSIFTSRSFDRGDLRGIGRRVGPVEPELGELRRDLGHLVLARLLDEVVRRVELVEALGGGGQPGGQVAGEADGEVGLEAVVVELAAAIADGLALGAGEVVAHHLAGLARGDGAASWRGARRGRARAARPCGRPGPSPGRRRSSGRARCRA